MELLSFDPSSSRIGYAVATETGRIMSAGLIVPDVESAPAWERIASMADDVLAMLYESATRGGGPPLCLVEAPEGSQHGKGGRSPRLVVWGYAVGQIVGLIRGCNYQRLGFRVVEIPASWMTADSKPENRIVAKAACPSYNPALDPGNDMADAIAMVGWWIHQGRPGGNP